MVRVLASMNWVILSRSMVGKLWWFAGLEGVDESRASSPYKLLNRPQKDQKSHYSFQ